MLAPELEVIFIIYASTIDG